MTKKLTVKSIRQGQTVYYVYESISGKFTNTGFQVNSKVDLGHASKIANVFFATYSRRKAIRKTKELNIMIN